jgi:hypothetical protein
MLISVSDQDFYSTYSPQYIVNGWEEFKRLRTVYELLGQGDAIGWADTILPHALGYDCRMQIYNWFGRWLKDDAKPVTREPEVKAEPDQDLWATEAGSTVVSLHSETPFTLLKRDGPRRTPLGLEELLAIERPAADVRANVLGESSFPTLKVEALEVRSAPGVWVPAWLMLPEDRNESTPVLVCLDADGTEALWFRTEIDQVLPPRSPIICAADVRGVGALEPEFSPGMPGYARRHQDEENYGWASLILGRPLLGQRVSDVLALTAALRRHPALGGRPFRVAASQRLTVPAMCAAALDPNIDALYLAGGLVSLASVMETDSYSHPFSNFVPQFLGCTDLPELAAGLAPRRVTLAGAVDGRGFPLSQDEVRRAFPAANVEITSEPEWTVARLAAWSKRPPQSANG